MSDEALGYVLARLQSYAARLAADDDFKEIVKQLKNRAIRQWASEPHPVGREDAWFDLQAIGRLEAYLKELADGKLLQDRKDDAAKAKAEKLSRR
jgi:hypothetical protein